MYETFSEIVRRKESGRDAIEIDPANSQETHFHHTSQNSHSLSWRTGQGMGASGPSSHLDLHERMSDPLTYTPSWLGIGRFMVESFLDRLNVLGWIVLLGFLSVVQLLAIVWFFYGVNLL